jgi:NAD(P)-dependent dehydrogenase (short-subunit alcohol dehydrogenase family)
MSTAGNSGHFSLPKGTVVITGAGGALAGAMARALGGLGLKVAVLDLREEAARKTSEAIVAAGGQALPFGCSVLDETQLRSVYEAVVAKWGAPDFLINGAGGNDPKASTEVEYVEIGVKDWEKQSHFLNIDMEGFERAVRLNFLGTVIPTKVFSRGMLEKGKGSIVNIASMSAVVP